MEGTAVVVTVKRVEPGTPQESADRQATEDDDAEPAGGAVAGAPGQVHVPVWVCTDPAAAGLQYAAAKPGIRHDGGAPTSEEERAAREAEAEARRQAESAQRRRVIEYSKAWRAAGVGRREWLLGFLTRRSVPVGAKLLIARAVLGPDSTRGYACSTATPWCLTCSA